ncbi:glycosyltransferase family 2 protein [Velocimicrobium porci]|uniref:Glycosyltransferase family 2 protein n=1 Tax=Velocimicrobium porci TaxID=2606634 RepID=A0A6L5XYE2_9FIRM|nr:glycosyltransferase family 2 protein [Velocimicrobium porci]MSS63258.1 glycosyltransferase family 2 protein [Velocimicrobium porci]
MANILYVVIPCYNEELVLEETTNQLNNRYDLLIGEGLISEHSKILYVNDGSSDRTWHMIKKFHEQNKRISGLNLSRNWGHQNALFAGVFTVADLADIVVTMDADLQDDIGVLEDMILQYLEGYDVVYGVRNNRASDHVFKRVTAKLFYRVLEHLGGEIVYNHAEYRLMSKRAVQALKEYKEVNLFLRGLVPMIGFPATTVAYERKERFAGKSKYSLKKMISFAIEGITSLSIKPIRIVTSVGVIVFLISIIMLIYIFAQYFLGNTVPGWSSVAVSVWAIGGLQLLSIGVIGEYIGKVYLESKHRPRYFIDEFLNEEKEVR